MQLATIGYEGAALDDFLTTLKKEGIRHLVDVRELPISRKRGFAKSKLAEALNAAGIQYTHLRELGDPKPGREAARRGDFKSFRRIFGLHLSSAPAQAALDRLENIASQGGACLMCYEKSAENCHRSIVASALQKRRGNLVLHLNVGDSIEFGESSRKRAA